MLRNYSWLITCLNLFRQNTYLRNKKHTLTCQGGNWLLTTGPVVSWRGGETPPPPPPPPKHNSSTVILCSTTVELRPLSLCGLPSLTFCLHLVDELVSSTLTKMSIIFSYSFLLAMSEVFFTYVPGVVTPASRDLSPPPPFF